MQFLENSLRNFFIIILIIKLIHIFLLITMNLIFYYGYFSLSYQELKHPDVFIYLVLKNKGDFSY